jgi:hypothetical protein
MPPGGDFTVAPPGAPQRRFHRRAHTHLITSKEHNRRQGRSRRGVEIGGESDVKSRAGSDHGSPRRGSGRRNSLVEMKEGARASISPKMASALVGGGDTDRQWGDEGERGAARAGLGRFDQTRPEPFGLASQVGWVGWQACWASRPAGPIWFFQLIQIQKFKFKFNY